MKPVMIDLGDESFVEVIHHSRNGVKLDGGLRDDQSQESKPSTIEKASSDGMRLNVGMVKDGMEHQVYADVSKTRPELYHNGPGGLKGMFVTKAPKPFEGPMLEDKRLELLRTKRLKHVICDLVCTCVTDTTMDGQDISVLDEAEYKVENYNLYCPSKSFEKEANRKAKVYRQEERKHLVDAVHTLQQWLQFNRLNRKT